MKKYIGLIAATAALGFASSAYAADMPVKARPMVDPVYNWTGYYLGVNAGYGWGSSNNSISYTNPPVTVTGFGPGSARGGFGGAQFGYNWQTGRFVFGLEADFEGAGISNTNGPGVIDPAGDVVTASQKLKWFYTARGRVGYTFDRALVYFTGGLAGGKIQDQSVVTNPATPLTSATAVDGTSRTGYVIGGGVEYAFAGPWSAKIEYQYINLGSQSLFGPVVGGLGAITTGSVKDQFSTVRLGVNYRFGAF